MRVGAGKSRVCLARRNAQGYKRSARTYRGFGTRATPSAADRKRILRFVIREVVLDQKRTQGQV
jgi:hypothetical protein